MLETKWRLQVDLLSVRVSAGNQSQIDNVGLEVASSREQEPVVALASTWALSQKL